MSKEKSIEQNINNLIKIREYFWNAFVLLCGATGGLVLSFVAIRETKAIYITSIILFISIILDITLFLLIKTLNKDINELVKNIEEC